MLALDLRQIGTIRCAPDGASRLELRPAYTEALDGLAPGQTIQVLYWMHELRHADRRHLRVHPQGNEAAAPRGVFSLRSPMRPNPIGVSIAEIERIEGSVVVVRGLDARDGSPLVDIKICHA